MERGRHVQHVFKLRIAALDYYFAEPKPSVDVGCCPWNGSSVQRVPVIRIFGSTPAGQKACLHIHRAFPYFYIPYYEDLPTELGEVSSLLRTLARSIEVAMKVAGETSSSVKQRVHSVQLVRGKPFYGYHPEQQLFVKISLYNPNEVGKVAGLLQTGAVMGRKFQLYESHIPFLLQFKMDFNLLGMGHIKLGHVLFREPLPLRPRRYKASRYIQLEPLSLHFQGEEPFHGDGMSSSRSRDIGVIWTERTVPGSWRWSDVVSQPSDVPSRQSCCELEADGCVEDVCNRSEVVRMPLEEAGLGDHVLESLLPMWEEERQRCGGNVPPRPPSPQRHTASLCFAVDSVRAELQEVADLHAVELHHQATSPVTGQAGELPTQLHAETELEAAHVPSQVPTTPGVPPITLSSHSLLHSTPVVSQDSALYAQGSALHAHAALMQSTQAANQLAGEAATTPSAEIAKPTRLHASPVEVHMHSSMDDAAGQDALQNVQASEAVVDQELLTQYTQSQQEYQQRWEECSSESEVSAASELGAVEDNGGNEEMADMQQDASGTGDDFLMALAEHAAVPSLLQEQAAVTSCQQSQQEQEEHLKSAKKHRLSMDVEYSLQQGCTLTLQQEQPLQLTISLQSSQLGGQQPGSRRHNQQQQHAIAQADNSKTHAAYVKVPAPHPVDLENCSSRQATHCNKAPGTHALQEHVSERDACSPQPQPATNAGASAADMTMTASALVPCTAVDLAHTFSDGTCAAVEDHTAVSSPILHQPSPFPVRMLDFQLSLQQQYQTPSPLGQPQTSPAFIPMTNLPLTSAPPLATPSLIRSTAARQCEPPAPHPWLMPPSCQPHSPSFVPATLSGPLERRSPTCPSSSPRPQTPKRTLHYTPTRLGPLQLVPSQSGRTACSPQLATHIPATRVSTPSTTPQKSPLAMHCVRHSSSPGLVTGMHADHDHSRNQSPPAMGLWMSVAQILQGTDGSPNVSQQQQAIQEAHESMPPCTSVFLQSTPLPAWQPHSVTAPPVISSAMAWPSASPLGAAVSYPASSADVLPQFSAAISSLDAASRAVVGDILPASCALPLQVPAAAQPAHSQFQVQHETPQAVTGGDTSPTVLARVSLGSRTSLGSIDAAASMGSDTQHQLEELMDMLDAQGGPSGMAAPSQLPAAWARSFDQAGAGAAVMSTVAPAQTAAPMQGADAANLAFWAASEAGEGPESPVWQTLPQLDGAADACVASTNMDMPNACNKAVDCLPGSFCSSRLPIFASIASERLRHTQLDRLVLDGFCIPQVDGNTDNDDSTSSGNQNKPRAPISPRSLLPTSVFCPARRAVPGLTKRIPRLTNLTTASPAPFSSNAVSWQQHSSYSATRAGQQQTGLVLPERQNRANDIIRIHGSAGASSSRDTEMTITGKPPDSVHVPEPCRPAPVGAISRLCHDLVDQQACGIAATVAGSGPSSVRSLHAPGNWSDALQCFHPLATKMKPTIAHFSNRPPRNIGSVQLDPRPMITKQSTADVPALRKPQSSKRAAAGTADHHVPDENPPSNKVAAGAAHGHTLSTRARKVQRKNLDTVAPSYDTDMNKVGVALNGANLQNQETTMADKHCDATKERNQGHMVTEHGTEAQTQACLPAASQVDKARAVLLSSSSAGTPSSQGPRIQTGGSAPIEATCSAELATQSVADAPAASAGIPCADSPFRDQASTQQPVSMSPPPTRDYRVLRSGRMVACIRGGRQVPPGIAAKQSKALRQKKTAIYMQVEPAAAVSQEQPRMAPTALMPLRESQPALMSSESAEEPSPIHHELDARAQGDIAELTGCSREVMWQVLLGGDGVRSEESPHAAAAAAECMAEPSSLPDGRDLPAQLKSPGGMGPRCHSLSPLQVFPPGGGQLELAGYATSPRQHAGCGHCTAGHTANLHTEEPASRSMCRAKLLAGDGTVGPSKKVIGVATVMHQPGTGQVVTNKDVIQASAMRQAEIPTRTCSQPVEGNLGSQTAQLPGHGAQTASPAQHPDEGGLVTGIADALVFTAAVVHNVIPTGNSAVQHEGSRTLACPVPHAHVDCTARRQTPDQAGSCTPYYATCVPADPWLPSSFAQPELHHAIHSEVHHTTHSEINHSTQLEIHNTNQTQACHTTQPKVFHQTLPLAHCTDQAELHHGTQALEQRTDQPEVHTTTHSEVFHTNQPEAQHTTQPDMHNIIQPEVHHATQREVYHTTQPEAHHATQPEVRYTPKPEVHHSTLPAVHQSSHSEVHHTIQPEVQHTTQPWSVPPTQPVEVATTLNVATQAEGGERPCSLTARDQSPAFTEVVTEVVEGRAATEDGVQDNRESHLLVQSAHAATSPTSHTRFKAMRVVGVRSLVDKVLQDGTCSPASPVPYANFLSRLSDASVDDQCLPDTQVVHAGVAHIVSNSGRVVASQAQSAPGEEQWSSAVWPVTSSHMSPCPTDLITWVLTADSLSPSHNLPSTQILGNAVGDAMQASLHNMYARETILPGCKAAGTGASLCRVGLEESQAFHADVPGISIPPTQVLDTPYREHVSTTQDMRTWPELSFVGKAVQRRQDASSPSQQPQDALSPSQQQAACGSKEQQRMQQSAPISPAAGWEGCQVLAHKDNRFANDGLACNFLQYPGTGSAVLTPASGVVNLPDLGQCNHPPASISKQPTFMHIIATLAESPSDSQHLVDLATHSTDSEVAAVQEDQEPQGMRPDVNDVADVPFKARVADDVGVTVGGWSTEGRGVGEFAPDTAAAVWDDPFAKQSPSPPQVSTMPHKGHDTVPAKSVSPIVGQHEPPSADKDELLMPEGPSRQAAYDEAREPVQRPQLARSLLPNFPLHASTCNIMQDGVKEESNVTLDPNKRGEGTVQLSLTNPDSLAEPHDFRPGSTSASKVKVASWNTTDLHLISSDQLKLTHVTCTMPSSPHNSGPYADEPVNDCKNIPATGRHGQEGTSLPAMVPPIVNPSTSQAIILSDNPWAPAVQAQQCVLPSYMLPALEAATGMAPANAAALKGMNPLLGHVLLPTVAVQAVCMPQQVLSSSIEHHSAPQNSIDATTLSEHSPAPCIPMQHAPKAATAGELPVTHVVTPGLAKVAALDVDAHPHTAQILRQQVLEDELGAGAGSRIPYSISNPHRPSQEPLIKATSASGAQLQPAAHFQSGTLRQALAQDAGGNPAPQAQPETAVLTHTVLHEAPGDSNQNLTSPTRAFTPDRVLSATLTTSLGASVRFGNIPQDWNLITSPAGAVLLGGKSRPPASCRAIPPTLFEAVGLASPVSRTHVPASTAIALLPAAKPVTSTGIAKVVKHCMSDAEVVPQQDALAGQARATIHRPTSHDGAELPIAQDPDNVASVAAANLPANSAVAAHNVDNATSGQPLPNGPSGMQMHAAAKVGTKHCAQQGTESAGAIAAEAQGNAQPSRGVCEGRQATGETSQGSNPSRGTGHPTKAKQEYGQSGCSTGTSGYILANAEPLFVFKPYQPPPPPAAVLESLLSLGVKPMCHTTPFFGEEEDVPTRPVVLAGREFSIPYQGQVPPFLQGNTTTGQPAFSKFAAAVRAAASHGLVRLGSCVNASSTGHHNDGLFVFAPAIKPPTPGDAQRWLLAQKLRHPRQQAGRWVEAAVEFSLGTQSTLGGCDGELLETPVVLSGDRLPGLISKSASLPGSQDKFLTPAQTPHAAGQEEEDEFRPPSPKYDERNFFFSAPRCRPASRPGPISPALGMKALTSPITGTSGPHVPTAPLTSARRQEHNKASGGSTSGTGSITDRRGAAASPLQLPLVPSAVPPAAVFKGKAGPTGGTLVSQVTPPGQQRGSAATTPVSQRGFKRLMAGKGQQLTIVSLEILADSRGTLLPDPRYDAVRCIVIATMEDEEEVDDGMFSIIVLMTDNQPGPKSQDALAHCSLSVVPSEMELFAAFQDVMQALDPDIILGWDIQKSSLGYLVERMHNLEQGANLLRALSRTPELGSLKEGQDDEWGRLHASGLHCTGRILLNLWRIMRGEVKLNIYSFENCCANILRLRVPRFPLHQLATWYSHGPAGGRWRAIQHLAKHARLNLQMVDELDLIGRTAEMARTFGIDFFSVLSRGSQYRVESLLLRLAHTQNYVLLSPSRDQVSQQPAMEALPLVMEPESRMYSDPVVVLDFQSLYPSMIIAYNLCFSTCLGKPSHARAGGVPLRLGAATLGIPKGMLSGDLAPDKLVIAPNGVAYTPACARVGVLPRMLHEILATRVMVKGAMKAIGKSHKVLQRVLNARQFGLKMIANVTYGYTAAGFSGRMPMAELADSIVQAGRETLENAIRLVESHPEWRARVVYGDTDSMFVLLPGRSKEQAFRIGAEIAAAVTAANPSPVVLKMEKVYHPCILQTKKRYVGFMYESPEQATPTFDAKGIETVRRDTCPAVAKVLEQTLQILFTTKDLSQVKSYLINQWGKMLSNRISIQDFVFAKEVRLGTYSGVGNTIPHAAIVATRAMAHDPRAEPHYQERVPYVVVAGEPGARLFDLLMEPRALVEAAARSRLNAAYYITKQIIPALERVLSLVGADVRSWYSSMPRTTRMLPQKRPASALPVPAQAAHPGAAEQRATIDQYYLSRHCALCDQLTRQAQPLCERCKSNPQMAIATIAARTGALERRHRALLRICLHCGGGGGQVNPLHAGVVCDSIDCGVYFERRKAWHELQSLSTLEVHAVGTLGY